MSHYSMISVIFNPKSTGASQENAEALRRQLRKDQPGLPIQIVATDHAGHAKELAYKLALASPRPLIISSSGDGGYNEVVNGVMRAQAEGAQVATGLLPSGNANDHYYSVTTGTMEKNILQQKERSIDLLHITAARGDQTTWQRYAHSYAGVGLTAQVVKRLNEIDLNPVNELVVATRIIYNTPPTAIKIDGHINRYDSLIFSNVSRLAKVFNFGDRSRVDDGVFEVIILQSKNKAMKLREIAKALAGTVERISQTDSFVFETVEKQAIQLDGEIVTLTPGTHITIRSCRQALRCVM